MAAYVSIGHKVSIAGTAGKVNRSDVPSNGDSFQQAHEIWIGLMHRKFILLLGVAPLAGWLLPAATSSNALGLACSLVSQSCQWTLIYMVVLSADRVRFVFRAGPGQGSAHARTSVWPCC